jgi:hypothetical protein
MIRAIAYKEVKNCPVNVKERLRRGYKEVTTGDRRGASARGIIAEGMDGNTASRIKLSHLMQYHSLDNHLGRC